MLLVLLAMDDHNEDGILLPPGTVYTLVRLTPSQWALSPERLASEYMVPIVARTQQQFQPAREEALYG